MARDTCGLSERVQRVPLFKIYGKYLRIEPREVGQLRLDMGEEFVPVGSYAVPIPPVPYLSGELPAALYVLPPLVMVSGGLGVVVVDHHPQGPVLHLSPLKESVYGFVFGLVELQDDLVK